MDHLRSKKDWLLGLIVLGGIATVNVAHADGLVWGEVVKNTDGTPKSMRHSEARDYCTSIGARLGTAREFAEFATTQGAAGIQETAFPSTFYGDPALNPETKKQRAGGFVDMLQPVDVAGADAVKYLVDFYYNRDGYKAPTGFAGDHYLWTSSPCTYPDEQGEGGNAAIFSGPFGDFQCQLTDNEAKPDGDNHNAVLTRCVSGFENQNKENAIRAINLEVLAVASSYAFSKQPIGLQVNEMAQIAFENAKVNLGVEIPSTLAQCILPRVKGTRSEMQIFGATAQLGVQQKNIDGRFDVLANQLPTDPKDRESLINAELKYGGRDLRKLYEAEATILEAITHVVQQCPSI